MKTNAILLNNSNRKICRSDSYNFVFDKTTGFFARWGKTKEDDPSFSPYGPEILDLEISTSPNCSGRCKFCYKKNSPGQIQHNMTFEEFKTIFHKINANGLLTQIAFGICDIDTNPDFFAMMEYARKNGVIPNYTCNGHKITEEIANKTAELCGAVAVSIVTKESSYNAVDLFTKASNKLQVNIHYMLSMETYEKAFKVVEEIATDPRLKKLNAIVFLQYKPKNREAGYHSVVDTEKYKKLIAFCTEKKINYGFDSCSAPIFYRSIVDHPDKEKLEMMAEPCESGLFSSYINCHGEFFVCSFSEGESDWKNGLDVLNCQSFLKDIWYNKRLVLWRERLLKNNRNCPIYDLEEKNEC